MWLLTLLLLLLMGMVGVVNGGTNGPVTARSGVRNRNCNGGQ